MRQVCSLGIRGRAAAGGHALKFVDDQPVVALGGQQRGHPPSGGLVAVIVQDLADRPFPPRDARILPDTQPGPGVNDAGRVVGLISPQRRDDQRCSGG